jgi:tRNA threonylcarbamoyladenosine modification (KEOPS) complex  Pcc1 subunit
MRALQESGAVRCEEHWDAMSVLRKQGVLQRAADRRETNQRCMTFKARFFFHFSSRKKAGIVVAALSPESSHKIPKSNISFSLNGTILKLSIEADDVSSLRAAVNSYLRWIQTALAVEELV